MFAEWNDGADEREGGGACAYCCAIDITRGVDVRILLLKKSWIWTLGSDAGVCIRNLSLNPRTQYLIQIPKLFQNVFSKRVVFQV